ncbi:MULTISPECIES: acyl carrier protein [unclassified Micromonospora]|uniref:acyl carrier protein n=1 Tax=unclassified Micromonospora TaxID=2617518 RepID=UPI0010759687
MTVSEQIRAFLARELDQRGHAVTVTDDLPLLDQGLLDSLAIMQLVGFMEDTYRIEINPEEIVPENFATVRDMATLVEHRRTGPHEPSGTR